MACTPSWVPQRRFLVWTPLQPRHRRMEVSEELSAPEAAMLEVIRLHGLDGAKAVATFMHAMGSEATLAFGCENGGGWVPCDFVMQHAWSLGATP